MKRIIAALLLVAALATGVQASCPGQNHITNIELEGAYLKTNSEVIGGVIQFQLPVVVEFTGNLVAIQLAIEFNNTLVTPVAWDYNENFSSTGPFFEVFNPDPPFGALCTTCPAGCGDTNDTFIIQVAGATKFVATGDNVLGWVTYQMDTGVVPTEMGTIIHISCGETFNGQLTSWAAFQQPSCQETWTDWAISGALGVRQSACIIHDFEDTLPNNLDPVDWCPGCGQPGQCPYDPPDITCRGGIPCDCCSLEKPTAFKLVPMGEVKSLYKEDD